MGVGKSTVGQALALRLGRPFVDLDEEITRRRKQTVDNIFETEGESAFRTVEWAELCLQGERIDGVVIALGGGALLDAEQRRYAQELGQIVCLDAKKRNTLINMSMQID